jgi:hypothetical protein
MGRQLDLDIVNIVATNIDDDGFLEGQYDADGDEGSPSYPHRHPHGLFSRPLDPVVDDGTGQVDPSQACSAFAFHQGGEGHIIALDDPRTVAKLPAILPGETCLHNDFGCFQRLTADGSLVQSTTTTGGGNDGQGVAQWVTPTMHQRTAPWGRETFDQMSFRWAHAGGAKLTLGFISGMPAPMDSGRSYVRAQADMVELNASAITIGPTGSVSQPVAYAQPLVDILSAIGIALSAISTALATGAPSGGGIPGAAVVAPLVVNCEELISGALITISTQTAIG